MTGARWLILAIVSAATAMLLLDVTIVYVALPAIQRDLGASFSSMQWVVDAYTVMLAATLVGAGALADRFGRRLVFVAGLVLFTFFSTLCGLAGSALLLDLARGGEGLGAAAMFTASLAILAQEFPNSDRGVALGLWGAVTGAALAIGPLLGGLIIDGSSWRWIFLVNIFLGLALIGATLRAVPESRDPEPGPLDVVGSLLLGSGTFLAVLVLTRGSQDGWSSAPILAEMVGAGVLLLAFVAAERRAEAPMLPLAFFRIPAFSGTAVVAFAQSVAIYPMLLFLAIYLQEGLGYSPAGAGLRLLPMTLVLFLVAPISGKLSGWLPLRVPLVAGLALLGAALLIMRGVAPGEDWTALLPGLLLGGFAIGTISPALAAAMVAVLPVERSGISSGINNTFRQLGIALGIAALGVLFADRTSGTPGPGGIVDGLNMVLLVAAVVALAGAVLAWPLLGRQRATQHDLGPTWTATKKV